MSGDIMAAAMQGRRKSLPDTRLVATTLHGRSVTSRQLTEQPAMPSDQIAMNEGVHAGCRADQASIGERLSVVPGMRPIESSLGFKAARLSAAPGMRPIESSLGFKAARLSVVPGMRPMICVGEA